VIGVIADAELAPDDRRHPLGGQDLATEAKRFGALRQQLRQLLPLLVRQLRGRARRHPVLQRLNAAIASTPHPLAHHARRHPEGVRDGLLLPSALFQLPRSLPTPFARVAWSSLFGGHARVRRTSQATLSGPSAKFTPPWGGGRYRRGGGADGVGGGPR
jgi:hypothetical protein